MNEMNYQLMQSMKQVDFLMLKEIYLKRCLTIKQAWNLFYKEKNVSYETFKDQRIIPFMEHKVIKLYHSGNDEVIFLTNNGIEIIRHKYSLPTHSLNSKNKITRDGLTEANLTLNPKLINHQVHLNQFVINFDQEFKKRYPEEKTTYFDEKYLSKYQHIRPDGMISIGKTDLFLEMDMGTETKKQLLDKFTRYRMFLGSKEFLQNTSKVVVLFILKTNPEKLRNRKDLVQYAIMQTLTDAFPENFDIYIGTAEELLGAVYNKVLPIEFKKYKLDATFAKLLLRKHEFTLSKGERLKNVFYDSSFRYYIRKLNNKKQVLVENGFVQEFIVDDYYYSPMAILSKLSYLQKTRHLFYYKYKRKINMILIVPDIQTMKHELTLNETLSCEGLYFTTLDRLLNMPFHEALFTLDSEGHIKHCVDTSYQKLTFEKTI